MKTTIDLPADLVNEALKVTHCKTKAEVVRMALHDLVRKECIQGLKQFKGKIKLDINLDELRRR